MLHRPPWFLISIEQTKGTAQNIDTSPFPVVYFANMIPKAPARETNPLKSETRSKFS